jgi:lysophospholipase L1-like esterase
MEMRVESLFNQARGMVKGLYFHAMDELGFRPEQAFAYAQDDLERLMRKDAPGPNAILQTAIYMEGLRRGMQLSKEDPYTSDMLGILAQTYSKCSVESLIEADVDDEELKVIQSDMETVRKFFLL